MNLLSAKSSTILLQIFILCFSATALTVKGAGVFAKGTLVRTIENQTSHFDFTARAEGTMYYIAITNAGTNPIENYYTTFVGSDGTDTYHLKPLQAKGIGIPANQGTITPGIFPIREEQPCQVIWLAFLSGQILTRDECTNFMPMTEFLSQKTLPWNAIRIKCAFDPRFGNLPVDVKFFAPNYIWMSKTLLNYTVKQAGVGKSDFVKRAHLKWIPSEQVYDASLDPPLTDGYLTAEYAVQAVTNIEGAFFPSEFTFTTYAPALGATNNPDLVVESHYVCTATQTTPIIGRSFDVFPKISGAALMRDFRLGSNVTYQAYDWWLRGNPRYIHLEQVIHRPPVPESVIKRIRVIKIAMLTFSVVAFLIVVRQMKISKRKEHTNENK